MTVRESQPVIRPYRATDRAALFDVCVRTGYLGGDARGRHPDDDLLPTIFLAPYVDLEPELAFVADDGKRPVGYVIGAADTAEFVRRMRTEYLPTVADRFPAPPEPPVTETDGLLALLHRPEHMLHPAFAAHPAHLHIDLLPGHQRRGLGRALMARFLGALAARGVAGVHLTMVTANTAARAFYDRLGFHELPLADPVVTHLARSTAPLEDH
jgi:ribosomal protein S18 acetylase RimI-like enzyme